MFWLLKRNVSDVSFKQLKHTVLKRKLLKYFTYTPLLSESNVTPIYYLELAGKPKFERLGFYCIMEENRSETQNCIHISIVELEIVLENCGFASHPFISFCFFVVVFCQITRVHNF